MSLGHDFYHSFFPTSYSILPTLSSSFPFCLLIGCPKLKLYHDINGRLKGDGLCCYLKIESVQLALQLLDQSDYKGNTIKIEQVSRDRQMERRSDKGRMMEKGEVTYSICWSCPTFFRLNFKWKVHTILL